MVDLVARLLAALGAVGVVVLPGRVQEHLVKVTMVETVDLEVQAAGAAQEVRGRMDLVLLVVMAVVAHLG